MQTEKVVEIAELEAARKQHFNGRIRLAPVQALINKQTDKLFQTAVAPNEFDRCLVKH